MLLSLLLHQFAFYGEARLYAQGPDVELAPDTARHLALAFHKLVTNAGQVWRALKRNGRAKSGLVVMRNQDRERLRELCNWIGWRVVN